VTGAYGVAESAVRCAGAALLALAACAACAPNTPKPEETANILPADFRTQVADQVRLQFSPKAVRDAYIADPVLKTFLPTPRIIACVRFNIVDGDGVSKGNKVYAAYFYSGKITQVMEATVEQCDRANYLPFPELKVQ
jgi:hypothetical protein